MVNKNDQEFLSLVFARLYPQAVFSVREDRVVSTSGPSISFEYPGYKAVELDARLFLDRYERHGIEQGDIMTRAELVAISAVPAPFPSPGAGRPDRGETSQE